VTGVKIPSSDAIISWSEKTALFGGVGLKAGTGNEEMRNEEMKK